jgi:hypothetical protein
MANRVRRITSAVLNTDREVFDALQGIKNYAPSNPAYSTEAIKTLHDRVDESQREAVQADAAADAKHAAARAATEEFHEAVLGAKVQVEAQFGSNSDEYASLKLKKKSEYKTPTRAKKTGSATK